MSVESSNHSPQLTVEESVTYSAWLRLPSHVDEQTRSKKLTIFFLFLS
uniref:Uncharacterized protein n=1 Tax=Aegilops tauschii subsp. strangulata TaxID=200361 RepID=A0A453QL62_AEGTS